MLPHIHVHRGSQHHRRRGSQIQCGKKIVSQPARKFRQRIRRRRSHQQQIRPLCHGNVLDCGFQICVAGFRARKKISDHFLAAERGEGKRCDELARSPRHHHLNGVALRLQPTNEFRGLVSRNSAGNAEGNAHGDLAGALLAPLRVLPFLFSGERFREIVFD